MTKRPKFLLLVAAIIALPIAGYVASYLAATVISPSQKGAGYHGLLTLLLILGLLAVPYAMLKLLAHAAHTLDPRETIPELKDLPKDKDQLDTSPKRKT